MWKKGIERTIKTAQAADVFDGARNALNKMKPRQLYAFPVFLAELGNILQGRCLGPAVKLHPGRVRANAKLLRRKAEG